jgi:ribonuclease HII
MSTLFQIPTIAGVTRATAKQQMLKQLICTDAPEQALRYHGYVTIAGVDEVGRGALFGPVVAAAVILPTRLAVLSRMGLKDSKQLTREQRELLDRKIRKLALCFAIAEVDAATIDRVNIYQASRLAMLLAVQRLPIAPDHLLIDAMRIDHPCAQTRLFYGDALSLSIAAASVIAKVHRDALMRDLDRLHPQYGLAAHKGYATPEHRRALAEHGPCPLHRKTFAPVAAAHSNTDPNAALDLLIDSGDLFLHEPVGEILDDPSTEISVVDFAPAPPAGSVISPEALSRNSVILSGSSQSHREPQSKDPQPSLQPHSLSSLSPTASHPAASGEE